MSETLVIEAVSDKFKNKYSAGSVMSGGKWLQVSSKLDLSVFKKGNQISVETVTNDKGYTSIVGIANEAAAVEEAPVKRTPKAKAVESTTSNKSYEDNKNRRILVQGITQAVVQSPATINFGDDIRGIADKVKELSLELISFVDEQA